MPLDSRPLRRVEESATQPLVRWTWPATLPAVAQLLNDGLAVDDLTVLVGENGSGKSTVLEGIALAYGLSPEGGSTGAQHSTRPSESPLAEHLQLVRNPGASRRGYFFRAETMHGFFTYLEENPGLRPRDSAFHEMSHGESFLSLVSDRFRGAGLWLLDEPESALSFASCLSLMATLRALVEEGDSQVMLATHSPLLAAIPGATLYELGEWGLRRATWEELALVRAWRGFLESPEHFLRHL